MNMERLIDQAMVFLQRHSLIGAVLLLIALVAIFKKPKEFFKLAILVVVIGVAMYFITLAGDTMFSGVEKKDKMVTQTREKME